MSSLLLAQVWSVSSIAELISSAQYRICMYILATVVGLIVSQRESHMSKGEFLKAIGDIWVLK